jgi:glycosyltransferase involved in cell wall biosynthesis
LKHVRQAYPKISVVTVVYNGADFLERTIRSVLDQQYPNLEYIIIDGGSTDGSLDIIKKYGPALHYWISEKDQGMYDALQKGFTQSTGEIMAWINADDIYHARSFFNIARIFSDFPQIKWLTGVPCALDESDTVMVPSANDYPAWSKLRFYSGDFKWIQQESTVWKRSLWEQAGNSLNTNLKYAGDFELWLRFFKYAQLFYVPMLIGGFRHRKEGQKSVVHYQKYIGEVKKMLSQQRPVFSFLLVPINLMDRVLISIPGIKKLYYKTGLRRLLGFAPKMAFNTTEQKFEIV